MIYTRFGTPVDLLAYCGKHTVKGLPAPVMLVQVRYDDGSSGYRFAFSLKADGGINEIEGEIGKAPEVKLSGAKLKEALKAAA